MNLTEYSKKCIEEGLSLTDTLEQCPDQSISALLAVARHRMTNSVSETDEYERNRIDNIIRDISSDCLYKIDKIEGTSPLKQLFRNFLLSIVNNSSRQL